MKIEIEGEEKTRTALIAASQRIANNVRKAIQRATLDLMGRVKERKLSGQVLKVQTGRLRRSINQRVETEGGSPVGYVGTNVEYARVHELGFKGRVAVKAHTRSIKGKRVPIRAHSRNMDIPKRPFLRPAFEEQMPTYRTWIADAVKEGSRAAGA